MNLKHGDKLFEYYAENKIPPNMRFSFFGANFGTVEGFSQYIEGYKYAVKALYNDYISCECTKMDILDTLVYPLCFLYRHIVELYIKYLYFKYSDTDDTDKKSFIKTVNHRLNEAWTNVKPHVVPLLAKLNSSLDLTLFDDFIDEIDSFDTDSFRMRYPIKKDLATVHNTVVKLNVIGLHAKMLDFYKMFDDLDNELDGVFLNNNYDVELLNKIKALYCKYRSDLLCVLKKLLLLAKKEETEIKESCLNSFSEILENDCPSNNPMDEFSNVINEFTSESAALLGLLIQVGRNVVDGRCKLAITGEERKKDFFKLIELSLKECDHFISFEGNHTNYEMCYALFEKSYSVSSIWLNKSLDIMEKCIIDG